VTAYPEVDYLAIGHASLDLIPSGSIPGGSVTYAARVAEALGCRAAVVTSVASDFDLESAFPGMAIENVPSGTTTTFENIYKDDRRRQKIYTVASSIEKKHIPSSWIRAPIVHLGPIANEIDPSIISLFSNSIVGLTPQGWLRTWNERGQVRSCDWPEANDVLPMAAAVILSVEDLHDPSVLEVYRERARLLVLTEQAGGCTVHCRGESRHFPAPQVIEVNPTGSGDSFAAAYFIRLHQTRGNPWDSAEFANRVAAASVTKKTIEDKIVAISKIVDGGYDSDLQFN
jgi:sugar/nucleoside kinase (ribokinase family)